jgi:hypothetical protein
MTGNVQRLRVEVLWGPEMRLQGWVLLRSILLAMTFVVGCVVLRFGVSEYSSTNKQDGLFDLGVQTQKVFRLRVFEAGVLRDR